jgi:hypothetical protein
MGPGMMGPGMMGRGMMGSGWAQPSNQVLSVDEIRRGLDRWVAATGNPNIKVGKVTEKDANLVVAEIVTTDKAGLVQRFQIDRRTGYYTPIP